jgi:hypothetical protein
MPAEAHPMADLEHILQQLHDSEINAGVQTFDDAGMRVWIGDEMNGIPAETTMNRTRAARLKWPKGSPLQGSLQQAGCMKPQFASILIADMPRTTRTKRTSLVEKRARAVCAGLARATESEPMQWRMVRLIARSVAFDYKTADAAISYAIEKGWLIGKGVPPHSVCLTDSGRSLLATSRRAFRK